MGPRSGRLVSLAIATAVLLTGCSVGGGQPGSPVSQDPPVPSDTADDIPRTSEQIDIGGRSLSLQCWGGEDAGEPTVMLIAGQGPTASSWEPMARKLAAEGRYVCAYDRAGVGGSDAAPEGIRTMQDQVAELLALLDAADVPEPVVLAAHSLGSLPAVGVVAHAPERVAGVVLIAPWSPRALAVQATALPPEQPGESPAISRERQDVNRLLDPAQNPEHLLLSAANEEVARLFDQPGPIFGDIPVIVLTEPLPPPLPGLPESYHAAMLAAYTDGPQEFADESTRGTLIEVQDTGHNIQDDQPEIVMDAVREVLAGQ